MRATSWSSGVGARSSGGEEVAHGGGEGQTDILAACFRAGEEAARVGGVGRGSGAVGAERREIVSEAAVVGLVLMAVDTIGC